MTTRYMVRVSAGFGMGTHSFRARQQAEAFIADWLRASDTADAEAQLIRNHQGKVTSLETVRHQCGYFALCTNAAVTTREMGPVGKVKCCKRCADRYDMMSRR